MVNYPNSTDRPTDPQAQYLLGSRYLNGIGVPKDPKRAFYWFSQAARQAMPRRSFALGPLTPQGSA